MSIMNNYKNVIVYRVTRLDDETIARIVACEDFFDMEEEFADIAGIGLVKCTILTGPIRRFARIVYLRQIQPNIGKIKREFNLPDNATISGYKWGDGNANFIVKKGTEIIDRVSIPIKQYHCEYQIYPAEPYYVYGCESRMWRYLNEAYNAVDAIFSARGDMFNGKNNFRSMPLDAEMLREIRKTYPDACLDFEQQTPDGDYVWYIELVHLNHN